MVHYETPHLVCCCEGVPLLYSEKSCSEKSVAVAVAVAVFAVVVAALNIHALYTSGSVRVALRFVERFPSAVRNCSTCPVSANVLNSYYWRTVDVGVGCRTD